ncbi:hypothetical protein LMG19282_00236 [Cupriavidus campinensis]|nr:hypothetical protein LMG19282_00236 [Cupriavidus campinensis]
MYVGDEAFLGEMLNSCYTIKVSDRLQGVAECGWIFGL